MSSIERTHCTCGKKLPKAPSPGEGDWGAWKCTSCGQGYCQDCGSPLDYNEQCMTYVEMQQELYGTAPR